jgi:hypothetical protein
MRRLLIVTVVLCLPLVGSGTIAERLNLGAGVALAGQLDLEVCGDYSSDQGPFVPSASPGLLPSVNCGPGAPGLRLHAPPFTTFPYNTSAGWETTAPPGIAITGIYTVGDFASHVGTGQGWWGEFYWDGGRSPRSTTTSAPSAAAARPSIASTWGGSSPAHRNPDAPTLRCSTSVRCSSPRSRTRVPTSTRRGRTICGTRAASGSAEPGQSRFGRAIPQGCAA